MTAAFVRTSAGFASKTAANTLVWNYDATTPVGNLVIVRVAIRSGVITVSSIVDTAGNTFALAGLMTANGTEVWYSVITTQALTSDTITVTLSANATRAATYDEFSGSWGATPFIQSNPNGGTGTNPNASLSGVVLGNMLYGGIGHGGAPTITLTPTTNWTGLTTVSTTATNAINTMGEYLLNAPAGVNAESATLSASAAWGIVECEFQETAPAGGKPYYYAMITALQGVE